MQTSDPARLPAPAVLARTAVACASSGTLTTYPRGAGVPPHEARVDVTAQPDGSVVAHLDAGDVAAQILLARPLASVRITVPTYAPVLLQGAVRRLPGTDDHGRLTFHIAPGAVRVGRRREVSITSTAYAAALPDPLREQAPQALAHLNRGHRDALTACLQALGHDAETVEASQLDQYGLTVVVLGVSGVGRVRLAFPRPVSRLADLGPGLAPVLLCRCHCA